MGTPYLNHNEFYLDCSIQNKKGVSLANTFRLILLHGSDILFVLNQSAFLCMGFVMEISVP